MREEKKFKILAELKREQISKDFEVTSSSLTQGYTSNEITSWDRQYAEAVMLQANSLSLTPLLSAIATARGITVEDLAGRVIDNADYFQTEIGKLLGLKQYRLDRLKLLELDEVSAVEDRLINLDDI